MDLADQAQLQALPLEQTFQRKPEGPKATGRCLNCDKKLPLTHRWCDAECLADWRARQPK